MKSKGKKIGIVILSAVLAMLFMLSMFSFVNTSNFVQAEETQEKPIYTLLPPTYNSDPSKTEEKYNITTARTNSFTPFDIEEEKRMTGMSFLLPMDEKNQIIDRFVTLDTVTGLDSEIDYSLNLWMYFDSTIVHSLTITLEFENGSLLVWSFSENELYEKLVKSALGSDFGELPFAWNRFELPFALAQKTGDINNGETIYSPKKMYVNYSSVSSELESFSAIKFYNIYLQESTSTQDVSVEKQQYRFYSFNFFKTELAQSLCKGDTLTIPSKAKAISFAWNGERDLTIDTDTDSIIWRVVLKTPDSENQYKYMNFGETITFDTEGTYQLYYQCIDTSYSENEPIVSNSVTLRIRELNAVYFDKSSYNIEIDKSYIINVHSSSLFSSVSDFTFETSSENISVDYLGNGVIKVTATEAGDYTITAKVNASRVASPAEKEYSSTIKFSVSEQETDNNAIIKIILWCALGVFAVAAIVVAIIAIVKANRYSVK